MMSGVTSVLPCGTYTGGKGRGGGRGKSVHITHYYGQYMEVSGEEVVLLVPTSSSHAPGTAGSTHMAYVLQ